jgi:hypothetical protein
VGDPAIGSGAWAPPEGRAAVSQSSRKVLRSQRAGASTALGICQVVWPIRAAVAIDPTLTYLGNLIAFSFPDQRRICCGVRLGLAKCQQRAVRHDDAGDSLAGRLLGLRDQPGEAPLALPLRLRR